MSANYPQILLFMCNDCKGMTDRLFPELRIKFTDNVKIMPVECPSQIDPFLVIKLMEKSCDGVIIACPKDKCCCPANRKVLKRKETVKDMLPVFGFHRDQFQIASVSYLGSEELQTLIENMLAFLRLQEPVTKHYDTREIESSLSSNLKWVN